MSTLGKVLAFATKAHIGQNRWNGEPYICHPIRVMLKMETVSEKKVALLHDVVEDTYLTFPDIGMADLDISTVEMEALKALTKYKDISYDDYIKKQVAKSQIAIKVKLADLEDNLNILEMGDASNISEKRLRKYFKAYQYLKEKVKS